MRECPAWGKWREPSAEKQNRAEAGDGDHAGVFGDEEHGELEAGVFGVKAGDQFGFGLGEIEGDAIGFRYGGYEEAEEPEDLRKWSAKNVPAKNAAESEKAVAIGLIIDDVAQAEAAGHQQDAD